MAISSPLLETAINGAKGIIINVTASPDIGLDEIETASSLISQQADKSANIIWGAAFDETMDDEISVTVVATGFAKNDLDSVGIRPAQTANNAGQANSNSISDDERFYDIMSIFKNK